MNKKAFNFYKQLEIFITMDCNLDCSYCYEKGRRRKTYISNKIIQDIKNTIKKDKTFLCDGLIFFGGEPMLNQKVIIDFIKDFKNTLVYSIMTNGTIPLDNFIKETKEYASNIEIDISYDGEFNYQRKSAENKILENYKKLKDNGYNLSITTVYSPDFAKDPVKNILYLASKFYYICVKRHDDYYNKLKEEDIITISNSIKKLVFSTIYAKEKYKTFFKLPDSLNHKFGKEGFYRRSYKCDLYSATSTIIGIDGKLYPCEFSVLTPDKAYANSIIDWRKKPQFFEQLEYNKNFTDCRLRTEKRLDSRYEKKAREGRLLYERIEQKFSRLKHASQ